MFHCFASPGICGVHGPHKNKFTVSSKESTLIHILDIKIRGYHIDVFGHVNNARYLEFLEEARWAAFEVKADLQALAQKSLVFTVVNININYRRPAVMNNLLRIETQIKQLGRRSGVIHQAVKHIDTETVVADAEVTFVIVDINRQKSVKFEGELLALLESV
jgi:thioesterase-3